MLYYCVNYIYDFVLCDFCIIYFDTFDDYVYARKCIYPCYNVMVYNIEVY